MKPVMFTRAQTEALCEVIGEVLASSPEEVAGATGLSLRQASTRFDVLDRVRSKLWASFPKQEPDNAAHAAGGE